MKIPRVITGILIASLALSALSQHALAQFDPNFAKDQSVFSRPDSLNRHRYTDRGIEEAFMKTVDTVKDSITTFESRRLKLRAAQMRRIAEESAVRNYTRRQERILNRLERERQRVLESREIPKTGGTLEELRPPPDFTRVVRPRTPRAKREAIETRSVRPTYLIDPDNPCRGMSHKRLIVCLIKWQEEREDAARRAKEEAEGTGESTGTGSVLDGE